MILQGPDCLVKRGDGERVALEPGGTVRIYPRSRPTTYDPEEGLNAGVEGGCRVPGTGRKKSNKKM